MGPIQKEPKMEPEKGDCTDHSGIWDSPGHEKIKIFLWQILWNSIATKENLHKRVPHINQYCSFCPLTHESADHLLRFYPRASETWKLQTNQNFSHNRQSFQEWFRGNLKNVNVASHGIPWNVFFAFTLWHLWKRRNNWVFNKEKSGKERVV
ncbi:hypothetical protein RDABS01_027835 [Bienertia sinuspersici]